MNGLTAPERSMSSTKRPTIVISSGEPAGIGPDLCLLLATREWHANLCVIGDPELLIQRAKLMQLDVGIDVLESVEQASEHQLGRIQVVAERLASPCTAGQLDPANASMVIRMLKHCVTSCQNGAADAMVTAPVHKGIINDAGIAFSGHTELLAELTQAPLPVMLLCEGEFRVALATTHLPLSEVSAAITPTGLTEVITVLHHGLRNQFGIDEPRISVCGLNPHSGESGHLGREEIEVIEPTLASIRNAHGWTLHGPLPADTLFTSRHLKDCDAVLAMYHDQGLPVLKYAGFGNAVNVTLGLPIVRTSVDHGTALDLAGGNTADPGSLYAALNMAISSANDRATHR